MIKIYNARGMSGRIKEDVVEEAKADREFLQKAGFEVLCPVIEEGTDSTKEILLASKAKMDKYWARDKEMIRESHVVFDNSPMLNSEGVKHELGYARYNLWKPIVRIYPPGKLPAASSIAYFEDDYVCDSIVEAIEYVLRVHGTLFKRILWRIKLFNRCFLKWIFDQLGEWK